MRTPRSIVVGRKNASRSLLEVLQTALRLPRQAALDALKQKQVRICGGVCIDPLRRVKAGQTIQLDAKPRKQQSGLPEAARQIVVRHVDAEIVVVEKPAGLTTVRHAEEVAALGKRAKKFLPPTLVDLLPAVLTQMGEKSKGRIRAVHRIDKETSGLVVLARTPESESHLGKQFRAHTIGRRYLALVRGHAKDARIESNLVADRGDGRRGSGPSGQHAVTTVRVVEVFSPRPRTRGRGAGGEGAEPASNSLPCGATGPGTWYSLVECELETGRTHQVRIHLGEAGTPLCGERVYDRPLNGQPLPDKSGAKRPLLHAAYLAINHPATGKRMEWHAKMPREMSDVVKRLQAQG